MKKISLHHRLLNFHVQRIHGIAPRNVLDLTLPTFNFVKSKGMLENILRWEDDGGQIIEINDATVDQKRKNQ